MELLPLPKQPNLLHSKQRPDAVPQNTTEQSGRAFAALLLLITAGEVSEVTCTGKRWWGNTQTAKVLCACIRRQHSSSQKGRHRSPGHAQCAAQHSSVHDADHHLACKNNRQQGAPLLELCSAPQRHRLMPPARLCCGSPCPSGALVDGGMTGLRSLAVLVHDKHCSLARPRTLAGPAMAILWFFQNAGRRDAYV